MKRITVAAVAGALALTVAGPALGAHAADEIGLAWDGHSGFAAELDRPVFVTPRVVPGDADSRSFVVRNQGETAAVLTAKIVNVRLTGNPADEYYRDFTVNSLPVIDRFGTDTTILTTRVQPGGTATVDLDYDLPEAAVTGNYPVADEQAVSVAFDVRLTLAGESRIDGPPVSPTPTPSAPTPSEQPPAPGPPAAAGPGALVRTGAEGWPLIAAIGALLAGGGLALRRRMNGAASRRTP
ncbi:LPXTG cell wall anchor domain-containing protein [Mycetocola saprophilus]|uniref:LPXTG cell wall anchor domain-containing protein n=1 Tax=Mycetocola saprophilus TaxID=76636 RepID=UPI003BF058B7